MVNHNHDRIKVADKGEISDEIHAEVLEKAGSFEGKGCDGRDGWMGEHLMCLKDHTHGGKLLDVGGKAWPPIVLGEKHDCLQVAFMPPFEGAIGSIYQVMVGYLWYVEVVLEVELCIIECPVLGLRSVKEKELLLHLVDHLED